MSTTEQIAPTLNGWDLDEFQEAIDMVAEQPEAGRLVWRGRARWDAGFGLDVRTESIEQLESVMPRRFTLRGDHPPELLGDNTGPTAIETLLAALGSCVAGTYAAQATARGVHIDELEVELESSIDLNGFFGLTDVRPGLDGVRATFRVRSDADPTVLQEICEAVTQRSPVYDSLVEPVAVELSVDAL